jgi:nicotinamidase-related amidase
MTYLRGYRRVTVAKHALLVMDVQRVVVDRYPDPTYLPRLREAIGAARAGGLPVIYAVIGFRPGYPEISTRNKMFGALARTTGPTRRMSRPWPTG